MKKLFIPLAFVLFISAGDPGAYAQKTISSEKEKLIRELFEVTGAKEQADQSADTMLSFQHEETSKMLEKMLDDDKILSARDKAEIKKKTKETGEKVLNRVREFFAKEGSDIDSMMHDALVPLYDKTFTEDELRELIAFHKSSAGQKSIKMVPEILTESMAVMSKFMPKLTEIVTKLVNEEFALLKQDALAPKKKAAPKS